MLAYIKDLLQIILITMPFYVILRFLWLWSGLFTKSRLKQSKQPPSLRKENVPREIVLCLFVLFMAALLSLAFRGSYTAPLAMLQSAASRIRTGSGINLIPFASILSFFNPFHPDTFLVNIVGNIVMFLPWGLGLMLLWKKNQTPGRILLFCALLPVLIETTQLFIGRQADIDDWIMNFTGSCIGAYLSSKLRRFFPSLKNLAR